MATFSGKRKPTQKNRKGEILEDLPVFKGVTCAERNDRELARPIQLLNYQPITLNNGLNLQFKHKLMRYDI